MPLPIVIDSDPGQDDAIAIFCALGAAGRLHLRAITTVAGNVPLDKTHRNARIVCEWAHRPDVPVYAGCDRPLVREPVWASHVHGSEGLQGPPVHEPAMPLQPQHAVDRLVQIVRESDPPITLCALGPLTNVARALEQAPDMASRLREIIIMGGARSEGGNITPCAEFNMHADPHAAARVLASGAAITLLPLDATHRFLIDPSHIERLRALGNRAGEIAAQILARYTGPIRPRFGGRRGPLHDPLVILQLLAPQHLRGPKVHVAVETESPLTAGATVVDLWGITGQAPNVRYINDIDAEPLFALLLQCLAALP